MNICIFTVVKDEQDYLDDFLRYHTGMGLHIFVFEDLFSISHKDICDKYNNVYLHSVRDLYKEEEQEKLEYLRNKRIPSQTDFITRGLRYIHSLNKYDWCFVIDCDEYITSSKQLPDLLDNYKEYDAIRIYWMNYGCSGYLYKPVYDKPIYDIFTKRCGYEAQDYDFKNITKLCVNMHKWKSNIPYRVHFTSINWIKVDYTYDPKEIVFEPLYLRHYITKSFEEYCHKVYVRGMMHDGHRKIRSFFEMQPEYKDQIINDTSLHEYLKEKIGINVLELCQ